MKKNMVEEMFNQVMPEVKFVDVTPKKKTLIEQCKECKYCSTLKEHKEKCMNKS